MTIFWLILLAVSLLVMVILGLIKLGQISRNPHIRIRIAGQQYPHVQIWPYFRKKIASMLNRLWHFVLEAKDLKPATTKSLHDQVEKVKSIFRVRIRGSENEPQWLPEAQELTTKPVEPRNPEEIYLRAIKKNPTDRSSYEALGRLYLQNKNFTEAVEIFEYLVKLAPHRDIYFSNLGLAHYTLKDYRKAAENYEKALNINNKIPARWVNLALCYDAMDDYTKEVKALAQAVELDKLNISYMMMLADTYIKIPNNIRAEEILEQILSLDPTNKSAREKLMRLKI